MAFGGVFTKIAIFGQVRSLHEFLRGEVELLEVTVAVKPVDDCQSGIELFGEGVIAVARASKWTANSELFFSESERKNEISQKSKEKEDEEGGGGV